MTDVDCDVHSGDFCSPEEVPVFFDLQGLVPADRLENITVCDEAVANVVAPANRTAFLVVSTMDTKPTSVALKQPWSLFVIAQSGNSDGAQ